MGQRGTRRERQLARVLVLLGVFGVLALAAGGFYAGRTLWRLRMPHKSFTMAKEVYIDGCEHAYLYEPWKPDAGGLKGVSHYTLTCIGGHSSTPLPTCDELVARYVATYGPLPTDVRASARRSIREPACACDDLYEGDGTHK